MVERTSDRSALRWPWINNTIIYGSPTYHASSHDAPAWFSTRWDGHQSLARSACSWHGRGIVCTTTSIVALNAFYYSRFERERRFFRGGVTVISKARCDEVTAQLYCPAQPSQPTVISKTQVDGWVLGGPVEDDGGARVMMQKRRMRFWKTGTGIFYTEIGILNVKSLNLVVWLYIIGLLIWVKGLLHWHSPHIY